MPVAPQIVYTVQDDAGQQGTTAINVPNAFSLAQFQEFGSDMATLLDAILGGKVIDASICFAVDISALSSNTELSTSDIQELGKFTFDTVLGRTVICNVPTLDELLVAAGSHDIDTADLDIAAFVSMFEDGLAVTGGSIFPCDAQEDDIGFLRSARERFRSRLGRG